MNSYFICPICCDDRANDLRILKCGHTYCFICITKLNKGGFVECPTCKMKSRFKQNMRKNYALMNQNSSFTSNQSSLQHEPVHDRPENIQNRVNEREESKYSESMNTLQSFLVSNLSNANQNNELQERLLSHENEDRIMFSFDGYSRLSNSNCGYLLSVLFLIQLIPTVNVI